MSPSPPQLPTVYRSFFIFALVFAALAVFAEVGRPFISASSNVVAAKGEKAAASNSISTYRWNLDDAGLPLLSLPDRISGAVDLSLTYSMDQFQFPLFQSLYYNKGVGKYILMVMPENGGRAQFIDLVPVAGQLVFEGKGNSSLRLEDKGYAKLLTTREGTVYTFAPFGNGEFHCSQIRDRDGSVIDIRYTDDASIDTIVDVSGRTVSFGYEKGYVSSITQTWGPGSEKKQTWPIADDTVRASAAVDFIPAVAAITKRMPMNAITRAYTPAMAASDAMLAAIFGGPNAIAAAHGFEPRDLASQYPLYRGDLISDNGKRLRGHLSYAMHLYGSANGTVDTEIFVPSGFISHSNTPTPTDAAVSFYYPRLGNLTNVTVVVFHVANFGLRNEGERVRIGNTGGRGGSIACYRHSHIEFYRGDTGLPSFASRPRLRIDPASVFETSHIATQASTRTGTRSSY